jgi:hypothetical protein
MRARLLPPAAAALALALLGGCGSSDKGSSAGDRRARLERSVTAVQKKQGGGVDQGARCTGGGASWTCSLKLVTASPGGATDPVAVDYTVALGGDGCWTATFASGRRAPLHGCLD